ncbi:hypothetical protein ACFFJT_08085 [Dyella flava]|uniref:Transposase n=1 Tax=Dyella flava TaxID=1920170 RepID=A0ABS2K8K4_9GAMM|nr:hypothetical protein [Dyella flava]MBM7127552.1 hypothetical protein [Dyella flava]GLQ51151.1 hypothetical protein GCM10010872_26000 [Dyella flava]
MTPLDKPLKRQIDIQGQAFTVTMDATGIKITRKAHRNGIEVRWADLIKNDPGMTDPHESASLVHHA